MNYSYMKLAIFKTCIFFYMSTSKFLALYLWFEDGALQLMSAAHRTKEFAIKIGISDLLDL